MNDQYYSAAVILNFNNYSVVDNNKIFKMPFLSKEIEQSYNFLTGPGNATNDTIFMKGISIYFSGYSTNSVMSYFNYNLDSINTFYNGESYFHISSKKEVCRNYIQVQGQFSTRVIYNQSPYYIRNIENGQFSFLLYQ
jgi:hypothetical protein